MPSTLGIVASGVTSFNPSNLSGLTLWLDASDASTITASSGDVSQWNDKSVNAYNVTQATGANQPKTGTRTQNGLNVLDFDGSNDQLRSSTAAVTQFRTTKALTVFAVIKSDRTTNVEGIVGAQSANYDYNTGWVMVRRQGFLAFTLGNGTTSNQQSANNAARFSNSSTSPMIFTTDVSASANSKTAYVNLAAQTLTTFDGTMATSDFLGSGSGNHTLNIGGRGSLTGLHFDGFIGEIVIYDSQLSQTDRETVLNYLNAKWAVY